MTRSFNTTLDCPKCGHKHTAETSFERWMRNNPDLDSRSCALVRFDIDLLLHKYKTIVDGKGTRDIQCMMFVEVKTYNAELTLAQEDTLLVLDQVLRNRKPNIHSEPLSQAPNPPVKVYSKVCGRKVSVHFYGGHLLRFDGCSPETSDRIEWDRKVISQETLVGLLQFEIDPDGLTKLDHRRRSRNWSNNLKLPFGQTV